MSSPDFKQSEVNKVINILNNRQINFDSITLIDLGKRKYHEEDLIILGKLCLERFSEEIDHENFKVWDYILMKRSSDEETREEEEEMIETRKREMEEILKRRAQMTILRKNSASSLINNSENS